jgi:hypothetical protein
MLVPQLYGKPFVDVLAQEFDDAERVDIATAWVRASGVGLLWEPLTEFLKKGRKLRIVAGLDRENTSVEGLELLLKLSGNVKVWVRHNEASAIFHPKLYAFRTTSECRVLVGSNNLTGAGLSGNEELSGLLIDGRPSPLDKSLSSYLSSLRDPADGLVKLLDMAFLAKLEAAGYVLPEARLRGKAANQNRTRPPSERLFGFKAPPRRKIKASVPLPGPIEPDPKAPAVGWRRVFIRLRLSRGGTQGQLPVPVVREVRRILGEKEPDGPIDVILQNKNAVRKISPTYATRNPSSANTYKFEVLIPKGNAIIKLEFIGNKIVVEQFDTFDPAGKAIEDFIIAGLHTDPVHTIATTKKTSSATLYRYD